MLLFSGTFGHTVEWLQSLHVPYAKFVPIEKLAAGSPQVLTYPSLGIAHIWNIHQVDIVSNVMKLLYANEINMDI